jgi:Phage major capsid protein E
MPALDIFNNDAFSVRSLTDTINTLPYKPGRIGQLGLFQESGITTTAFMIEKTGPSLSLVPAAARGSSGKVYGNQKAQLIPFPTVHLPQRGGLNADEIQNVRAFGSESEVKVVQDILNPKLQSMRNDIDVTIEWQRIGALKGQVLDADGSTVLLDILTSFGLNQSTHVMGLNSNSTKVRNKVIEAKRKMEDKLGAMMYTGLRVLCSSTFFDALVSHAAVEPAFLYQDSTVLRSDLRGGFAYAGAIWEEYRGSVGGHQFIADGEAYMVPEGVPGLFLTKYAPADYMETVNTVGLPYYAKQELRDFNKGVDIEAQSNPINLCTRPDVPVKLTIS